MLNWTEWQRIKNEKIGHNLGSVRLDSTILKIQPIIGKTNTKIKDFSVMTMMALGRSSE